MTSDDLCLDQFYVQVRRPGVIAKSFLSIKRGIVSANVSVMYCVVTLCVT